MYFLLHFHFFIESYKFPMHCTCKKKCEDFCTFVNKVFFALFEHVSTEQITTISKCFDKVFGWKIMQTTFT